MDDALRALLGHPLPIIADCNYATGKMEPEVRDVDPQVVLADTQRMLHLLSMACLANPHAPGILGASLPFPATFAGSGGARVLAYLKVSGARWIIGVNSPVAEYAKLSEIDRATRDTASEVDASRALLARYWYRGFLDGRLDSAQLEDNSRKAGEFVKGAQALKLLPFVQIEVANESSDYRNAVAAHEQILQALFEGLQAGGGELDQVIPILGAVLPDPTSIRSISADAIAATTREIWERFVPREIPIVFLGTGHLPLDLACEIVTCLRDQRLPWKLGVSCRDALHTGAVDPCRTQLKIPVQKRTHTARCNEGPSEALMDSYSYPLQRLHALGAVSRHPVPTMN